MAASVIFSEEDTRSLVNTRARETNGDDFRIKVHRRPSMGGMLIHIATLAHAKAEHITYAETWLPKLCGGGQYAVSIFPADAPNQQIGGFINLNFDGGARHLDPLVMRAPDWSGPAELAFPDFAQGQPQVITQGAGGHFPHASAANSSVPGGGSLPLSNLQQQQQQSSGEWEKLLARERELQDRERRMREELLTEQSRLREERLRAEMQAKFSEIQIAHRPVENNGPEKLLAAAAPIITAMMQAQNESRMLMMKMQQDSQALAIQMQKDSQARTDELFKLMISKKDDGGSTAEMMGKMADVMGAVSKTSVSMIEAVAEMQFQNAPPEHPGLIAIREFGKAIRAVSSGTQESARKAAQANRALPNGQGQAPSYEQQARATPTQPPTAAPTAAPAQRPELRAVPAPAQAAPGHMPAGQGFGDMAPQGAPMPPNPLDEIAVAIKNYVQPTEVATAFVRALSNAQVQEEIEASDGSIQNLAVKRLGIDWIMAEERNQAYLRDLFNEINRLGTEAGIFEEGAEDDDNEYGEDDNSDDAEAEAS